MPPAPLGIDENTSGEHVVTGSSKSYLCSDFERQVTASGSTALPPAVHCVGDTHAWIMSERHSEGNGARLLALPLGRKLEVARGQAPRALEQRGQHGVPGRARIAQRRVAPPVQRAGLQHIMAVYGSVSGHIQATVKSAYF